MRRFYTQIFAILSIAFLSTLCHAEDISPEAIYSPQVIKVYDESEVKELQDAGVEILRRRGDILLCLVPTEGDNEVIIPNSMRKTRGYAKDKPRHRYGHGFNVPTLDIAKKYFNADHILTGNGFDQLYTGKGVVVGICDIGFDPLHPTFLDADGKSRVKRITQYKEREGIRIQLEGDDAYREWGTDDPDSYHATHVCGILAGNGAGSPYTGIALDADIVVSTSTLSDVGLLAGVEDIIDYAKEVGKPAVINLSMGNYIGAHDGSSLFSQYLDFCSEDAIIVLSAGNEGNRTNTLYYRFTDAKPEVSFRLGNSVNWMQTEMYGATDIWSGTDRPLSIRISIYDDETKSTVYSYPDLNLADYDSHTFTWNPERPDFPGAILDGYLTVYGGIDPENGRYQALLTYDFKSPTLLDRGWAKYVIRVDVAGTPGNDVDIFSDGSYTRLMGLEGNPAPNTSMSISDLACGFNVISVGMYGNRSAWQVNRPDTEYSGEITELSTGYGEAETVIHSSYGTLRDGRALPLTVAPGAPLVSSYSRFHAERHPEKPYLMLDAPWLSEPGTSMASPYVAGFIATWLEAIPSLSIDDAMRIIENSNRHDISDAFNPRNINGWFDPREALLFALRDNGVDCIEDGMINLRPDDNVEIFTTGGTIIYGGKYGTMPELDKGIYILTSKYGTSKIAK